MIERIHAQDTWVHETHALYCLLRLRRHSLLLSEILNDWPSIGQTEEAGAETAAEEEAAEASAKPWPRDTAG